MVELREGGEGSPIINQAWKYHERLDELSRICYMCRLRRDIAGYYVAVDCLYSQLCGRMTAEEEKAYTKIYESSSYKGKNNKVSYKLDLISKAERYLNKLMHDKKLMLAMTEDPGMAAME